MRLLFGESTIRCMEVRVILVIYAKAWFGLLMRRSKNDLRRLRQGSSRIELELRVVASSGSFPVHVEFYDRCSFVRCDVRCTLRVGGLLIGC